MMEIQSPKARGKNKKLKITLYEGEKYVWFKDVLENESYTLYSYTEKNPLVVIEFRGILKFNQFHEILDFNIELEGELI